MFLVGVYNFLDEIWAAQLLELLPATTEDIIGGSYALLTESVRTSMIARSDKSQFVVAAERHL